MKDYYQILSVPDDASQDDIRSAFRKLAFKHHPDTNPGNEKQAEEKFKEINEAYGVLGDEGKRQQYDFARRGQFAGVGSDMWARGFRYSQQDIFRDAFSNRAMFDELSRMFSQAGLRFDQDFLNRVFFGGSGFIFQVFTGPRGVNRRVYRFGDRITSRQDDLRAEVSTYRPSFIERWVAKVLVKLGRYALRKLLGLQYQPLPKENLDHHIELELSATEAAAGDEKPITYKRDNETKKLMIKIPPGVKTGAEIRLRGMGIKGDNESGDLYLHLKIKG